MNLPEPIHNKLLQSSRLSSDKKTREWTRQDMELFKTWLQKYLKRNAEVRNGMMRVARKDNNNRQVLEAYANQFILEVPFRMV